MQEDSSARILVTGAAGFIGAAVSEALVDAGHAVVGVDNLNAYYAPALKKARIERLSGHANFEFREIDICDHESLRAAGGARDLDVVIHLAAQAGVRYSIEAPFAYAASNLTGHLSVLELVRHAPRPPLLVYASSSSVYGANTRTPYSEADRVDTPVSLYAATKRANELMSESYARMYGLRQVGLRFFSVYGPWGRPDMAYWTFTKNLLEGAPLRVFNGGRMRRDFTYIDDIVAGVTAAALQAQGKHGNETHRIYNLGNNHSVSLSDFIAVLESASGRKAEIIYEPMQTGDVVETHADIDAAARDLGYRATTRIEDGLRAFVRWYESYHQL